jgi:hypothetical protein
VLTSGALALSELRISGIRMPTTLIEVSLVLFAVNAFVEGAITVTVLRAIERLHPSSAEEGLYSKPSSGTVQRPWGRVVTSLGIAAIAVAAVGILIASTLPDGLEHLARQLSMPFGAHPLFYSPLSEYEIRAMGAGWFSRATAGILGLLAVYAVCMLGGHLLSRSRRSYS